MSKGATLQQHQQALVKLLEEFDRVCRTLDIPYVLFAGSMLGAVRHQGFIPWDDDLDILMLRRDYERFLAEAERVLDTKAFFLQKEFSDHWPMFFSKLRLNGTTCLEKYHTKDPLIHQGVYIDLFPCDDAAAGKLGRYWQYLASKVVIAKCVDRRGYDTHSRGKKLVMALCRPLPLQPFLRWAKGGKVDGELVHTFLGGGRSFAANVYPRQQLTQRREALFAGGTYPIPHDYDALLRRLYGDYMQLPPPEQRAVKQHAVLVDLEQSYEAYAHYLDGVEFDVFTRSIR